ncbi:MAG TPA: Mur ligase family protein, partial [Gemmatimonadaceae bacterium]|nr:Mur ligase family protein [Gemmatimonadaceae bacterium]
MSEVATAALREALAREGLLVGTQGTLPETIAAISDDSRRAGPDSCFVAVRGALRDGHDFLPQVEAGRASATACAIAPPPLCPTSTTPGGRVSTTALPAFIVRETRAAAAAAAAAFYGEPAQALQLVGVTGTNGKTTTVGLLRHLLDAPETPSASIGTLGVLLGDGSPFPGGSGLTTPGPIELQRVLRALVDAGVRRVAMEVSSHALDQQRVGGLRFAAGVFTNLTRDHLDYHGTMDAYFAAKAKLVDLIADDGCVVTNADDAAWSRLPQGRRRLRFGLDADADVRADALRYTPRGSAWLLRQGEQSRPVALPLIGDFNVANALAAAAAALAVGVPF